MSSPESQALVRYGVISEVVRARWGGQAPVEQSQVILRTPRGEQTGKVLRVICRSPDQSSQATAANEPQEFQVVRAIEPADEPRVQLARDRSEQDFEVWSRRIQEWGLALELLDCEWTLNGESLILYVMGGRGADTTRLSLNAVGCGATQVVVQPVDHSGPIPVPAASEGGCGSCGCHN